MDFLDSLDLHTQNHKPHPRLDRMRSWYLYEQYKTLERSQLDAAQKLRERTLQERFLQRELAERRSRRTLYQPGAYHSAPPTHRDVSNAGTCLSTSTDDFYESFCELHDFETGQDFVDNHSHHDSDNTFMEDFKLEEFQDDTSCAESVPSVVDLVVSEKGGTRPQSAQMNIADSIKLHLETVKENMVSLERYARMADGDKASNCSVRSKTMPDKAHYKDALLHDSQVFCMWSRLVTFAYQIVQLNHGNCYYDYSSQLLTAVLACDALRRGINRMCDILQYYVSPIKFASDESVYGSAAAGKKSKKEKSYVSKKVRRPSKYKINSSLCKTFVMKHSEANRNSDQWRRHGKCKFEKKETHNRCTTQPWSSDVWHTAERSNPSTSNTLWPEELGKTGRFNHCRCRKVQNPMLKLVRYLDVILTADMEDFGHI